MHQITFKDVQPNDIIQLVEPAVQFHSHMMTDTPLWVESVEHHKTDVHVVGWYIPAGVFRYNLITSFTGGARGSVLLVQRGATMHDVQAEAIAVEQQRAARTIRDAMHHMADCTSAAQIARQRIYLRRPFGSNFPF